MLLIRIDENSLNILPGVYMMLAARPLELKLVEIIHNFSEHNCIFHLLVRADTNNRNIKYIQKSALF